MASELTQTGEAGPSTQIDTRLLLKELKVLQENPQRLSKSTLHKRVKCLWNQWNEFLGTPKGKTINQSTLYYIIHEFVFLYPGKLMKILEDAEVARDYENGLNSFDYRIFKSIGLAAIKYQNWAVLQRVLGFQKCLKRLDAINIAKIASQKILFSSKFKTQSTRIETLIELSESIASNFNQQSDCIKHMARLIEILSDPFLKMGCHEPASSLLLQIIHKDPNSAKAFSPDFIHRMMRTCVSHQDLSMAHDLLAELPPELQTVEQFKACMSVWDRRTSRPLLQSACSVWDALVSHPYLVPDYEAYNLYLSIKSKLGHTEDLIRIVNNMDRRGILVGERKQKTYGILLHSIGRRKGLQAAYDALPGLIGKGYTPDEYTSNILLSAKKPISDSFRSSPVCCRSEWIANSVKEREKRLIDTIQKIQRANMKSDEVTRNIVIRSFLSRSLYHSKEEILNLKRMSLDTNLAQLDRQQFRRFRKPLYSMLCSAFRRADCLEESSELEREWRRASHQARLTSLSLKT